MAEKGRGRTPPDLEKARNALARQAWKEAFTLLSAADERRALTPVDLHWLAISAFLIGRDSDCDAALTRAFQSYLARGEAVPAARTAFWLAFTLSHSGDFARASGWAARARRLLGESSHDCVERADLLVPEALQFRVVFHRILTVRTALGRKARVFELTKGGPLIRTRSRDLAAAGVERAPRIAGVIDDRVRSYSMRAAPRAGVRADAMA